MELSDFLLARFAEDEADWRMVLARDVAALLHGRPIAPRMLAECEAKKAIVDACWPGGGMSPEAYLKERVLTLLAQPYSDHPEFRDEWRA